MALTSRSKSWTTLAATSYLHRSAHVGAAQSHGVMTLSQRSTCWSIFSTTAVSLGPTLDRRMPFRTTALHSLFASVCEKNIRPSWSVWYPNLSKNVSSEWCAYNSTKTLHMNISWRVSMTASARAWHSSGQEHLQVIVVQGRIATTDSSGIAHLPIECATIWLQRRTFSAEQSTCA